jgi:hypothetical protein
LGHPSLTAPLGAPLQRSLDREILRENQPSIRTVWFTIALQSQKQLSLLGLEA